MFLGGLLLFNGQSPLCNHRLSSEFQAQDSTVSSWPQVMATDMPVMERERRWYLLGVVAFTASGWLGLRRPLPFMIFSAIEMGALLRAGEDAGRND